MVKLLISLCAITLFVVLSEGGSYNYGVVGLGSSGATIAAKLASDPSVTVCAFEEGGDHSGEMSDFVAIYKSILYPPSEKASSLYSNLNYPHVVDHFSNEGPNVAFRNFHLPAPRLLGGGTATNAAIFGRIAASELARWNSSLWTFDATLPAWKEIVAFEGCDMLAGCNASAHGTSGPIKSRVFQPDAFVASHQAAIAQAFGLENNVDINSGAIDGRIGPVARNYDMTGGNPKRQDAYTRILKPLLDLPNLSVRTQSKVLRVELNRNKQQNGKHKIVYLRDGEVDEVRVDEVIIAAGAINTPKILMLSGIGNCTELEALGIECRVDNPHVGKGLHDGVSVSVRGFSVIGPPAVPSFGAITLGHYRSPAYTGPGTDMKVSSASFYLDGDAGYVMSSTVTHVGHRNVGRVSLRDKDPLTKPMITLGMYAESAADANALVDGFKRARAAFATLTFPIDANTTMGQYFEVDPGFGVISPAASDAEILAHVLKTMTMDMHLTSTARMHKVVNERLQVIDKSGTVIPGLRVADLSVVPVPLVSHSTSSTSLLLAQHAAGLILEDYNHE